MELLEERRSGKRSRNSEVEEEKLRSCVVVKLLVLRVHLNTVTFKDQFCYIQSGKVIFYSFIIRCYCLAIIICYHIVFPYFFFLSICIRLGVCVCVCVYLIKKKKELFWKNFQCWYIHIYLCRNLVKIVNDEWRRYINLFLSIAFYTK